MNVQLAKRVESDVMNFGNGRVVTLKKDFLEIGLSMNQPMIRRMWARFQGNVTTGAGSSTPPDFLGGLLSHVYNRFIMKDRSGERINVSGGELRDIAQMELGIGFRDPSDIPPSTTTDVEFRLPFILTLADRAGSPEDSAMLLADFYSGGELSINFVNGTIGGGAENAPSLTVNSGTVTIEAEIVDYGNQIAPARLAWLSTALLNKDSSYPINGKLRAALLSVGDANVEAGENWDSSGETLESRSLNYIALAQTHFIEAYLEEGYHKEEIDAVANDYLLPLYFPNRGDKITDQPVFDNLHVKFSQTLPENSTIITGVWTQRSAATVALAFRGQPASTLQMLLKKGGVVPGLRGDKLAASFPKNQRAFLPVKLTTGTVDSSATTPVGQNQR